ncbi:MAG: transposase [Candidatus Nealsonbacteria bacterium]|nr:transposase [Candidatus Nealsonbacteria bacterium]
MKNKGRRPPLVTKEIYHIVIRAVDGLKLFRDKQDYLQMIHNLFVFNDLKPVSSKFRVARHFSLKRKLTKNDIVSLVNIRDEKREIIVEILAFCLMLNHVHLLVRQVKDGGIIKLMRKIGTGYGHYYNQKYKRAGHVFQGRYKIVYITNDNQLKIVFVYIHTNPVAIICPKWKEEGIKIKDLNKIIKFLEEEYRWSSYLDCLGNKNFPSVTAREWLINEMGGVKEARRLVNDWLQVKRELADSEQVAIE